MRSRTLLVLGGRDSASLDDGEPERENTVTECPQAARRPAAAAPAGPPPMIATSIIVRRRARSWPPYTHLASLFR